MGDDVTGEALREAMVAYRTRWEMVAAVEAEELRAMPMERRLRQYTLLIAMARAMGTFEAIVQYNEADVQPVRERWRMLKEKVKS
jgi:hypothetical protein